MQPLDPKAFFPAPEAIPAEFRLAGALDQRQYLCNGQLRRWDGPCQEVLSPICTVADGQPVPQRLGSYPLLTEKEAIEALDAASAAYDHGRGAWPTMTVEERIRRVEDFAAKMKDVRTEVVRRLMWEIGKTLADSEKEFDRTVEYIRDTIDALKELDRASSRFSIQQGVAAQIRRAPLGVVFCMGPYNYPLNETFTTLIPALIMGNTIVFKPPKMGVLLHEPLLTAFRDAFPPGVVNTVYGQGRKVAAALMASGRVDCLAFIGTSKAADLLKQQHPKPHRLRCVLGLEAKNAGIVLPDADLEATVKECVLGTLSFNGQRCTALKILFVHRSIAPAFLEKFSAAVSALKRGMPWEAGVQLTPLPEPGKPEALAAMVADAVARGAAVVNEQGGAVCGTYVQPAVLYPVPAEARLGTEEQFGPAIPVCPFDDIEEPMRYVIESNYGQQVAVFGSDPTTIARLVDTLVHQVCRVNINSQCQRSPDSFPFTGRKDSAEGTLSVSDALRVFSIRTLVAAKQTDANRQILRTILTERSSRFLSTDFIL